MAPLDRLETEAQRGQRLVNLWASHHQTWALLSESVLVGEWPGPGRMRWKGKERKFPDGEEVGGHSDDPRGTQMEVLVL